MSYEAIGYTVMFLAIAGGIGVLIWSFIPKPNKAEGGNNPFREGWKPTGRIDFGGSMLFMNDTKPAHFHLIAEDERTIASSSGLMRREVRWRKATLAEVKLVVKRYHDQLELDTPKASTTS